jgi:hypothetical protein
MKYLESYNEKSLDNKDEILNQISDILLDIKDDYPEIDGEIFTFKDDNPALFQVYLNCEKLKIDSEYGSISNYRSKIKFINIILDMSQRFEDAFGGKAFIPNLDEFTHWQYETIKITLYKRQ